MLRNPEKNQLFSNIKFVACKCFQFGNVKILSFGKVLIPELQLRVVSKVRARIYYPFILKNSPCLFLPKFCTFESNAVSYSINHYHTMPHFDALKIHSYGKHCEEKKNCL